MVNKIDKNSCSSWSIFSGRSKMFSMFDDDKSYREKLSKKNEGVTIQIGLSGTFHWEDDLRVRWDERASQVTTWRKNLSGQRSSDRGQGRHGAWHVWEGTRKWEGQWWGEEAWKGVRKVISRMGLRSWMDLQAVWLPWLFLWVGTGKSLEVPEQREMIWFSL